MLRITIELHTRPDGGAHMNLNAAGNATRDERALGLAIGNTARVIVESAGKDEGTPGAAAYDKGHNVLTLPPVEIREFI